MRPLHPAFLLAATALACAPSEPKDTRPAAGVPPTAAPGAADGSPDSTDPDPDGHTASAWHQRIAALDQEIAAHADLAEADPDSWTRQETVASAWIARARLTGSYDDYAMADAILDEAMEIAVEGSGPLLTRARLHITLHRLDRAEADLDTAENAAFLPTGVPEQIASLRAEIAWQRGQMDIARDLWQTAEATASSVGGRAGLIADAWHRGELERADALWQELRADISPVQEDMRSWVELQRGIMDLEYDRWDAAGTHFSEADGLFSGHWLNLEHRAEVLTLQGQIGPAVEIYTEVIAQTDSPEFMDALADIRESQGDPAAADELRAQARDRYDAQLARFPEAAAGHALDHLLAHGTPEEALALAQTNASLRPYPPALLQLVDAWLKVGDVSAAADTLAALRALPWVSPEIHEAAARVADAQGDAAQAEDERQAAEDLRAAAFAG